MSPPKVRVLLGLIPVLILAADEMKAATVVLPPSADTSLSQTSPNNNFGGEPFFTSGSTVDLVLNRALLKFDIASYIPSNATIQSVSLTLTVTQSISLEASAFSLHRMLQNWGEGTKASGGNGAPATAGEATWSARISPAP